MVNDLIIIRLKNVNENKKNKLLTYLKHNSFSYIEINKNTFYEKEKQKKGTNEKIYSNNSRNGIYSKCR